MLPLGDLVIYDTETTDLDVRHGQLTQFASIRVDEKFNILEERNIRVRRLPYVVPSPDALCITGTDPFTLDDDELPTEFEAAGQIQLALLPQGRPQTNLTFNGIGFDDELLRTTLFRNLRSPWFSSGKQICRVDLLPIIRLIHTYDPDVITIPENADGGRSWKLEMVARANGIDIDAHDALGDVKATLELARLVISKAGWAWRTARRCGHSATVEQDLSASAQAGETVWLFTHFGEPDLVPCAVLGTDGRKRWVLADLRASDIPDTVGSISDLLYGSPKESPFKVVRSTGCPLFLSPNDVGRIANDATILKFNEKSRAIRDAGKLPTAARRALVEKRYEAPPDRTSEERIYDGFFSREDEARIRSFHAASWQERAAIQFDDDRLRDFAARLILQAVAAGERGIPDHLVEAAKCLAAEAYARPFAGADARWMTLRKARTGWTDPRWEEWASRAFPEPTSRPEGPGPESVQQDSQLPFGF